MIVCPNCNHPNPDGAVQCEACYTPLPATTHCPSCGATVQADAAFCGQCGYNLHTHAAAATVAPAISVQAPPNISPDPFGNIIESASIASTLPPTALAVAPPPGSELPTVAAVVSVPGILNPPPELEPIASPLITETESQPELEPEPAPEPPPTPIVGKTQLQQVMARLFHVQSDREIELPLSVSVIHIGKPNDRIPPDIDVSGFPNSEIVSRIHADIRVEGDAYYIEDVGSSNGTYINNLPLLPGNRHRLRPGDRISLGKGDLVTFLFQFS